MLAGARNGHFQAPKAPLGPSGLLPANNKRWSVLKEATMYLEFNLQISRFSTTKMSSSAHNIDGGDDDNDETALAVPSVVSFSVRKGEQKKNTRFHSTRQRHDCFSLSEILHFFSLISQITGLCAPTT